MAANKKRKLDGSGSSTPTVMSAFAARQQLWGPPATRASSPSGEEADRPQEAAEDSGKSSEPRSSARPGARQGRKRSSGEDASGPGSPGASERQSLGPTPPRPPEPGVAAIRQHSSFRPNKKNCQRKPGGGLVLSAAEPERLVILGSFGVKVREGEATLAGAILTPADRVQWVHAPACHAVPVLRTSDDTVLELQPHPAAKGLRQLAALNPAFAGLWNEPSSEESGAGRGSRAPSTFQIICTSEDVPRKAVLQELVSPAEWNKKLSAFATAKRKTTPVVFLCGPKSSGKSTFGKLLANRLITDRGGSKNKPWSGVMVLDLDPGQPEYSPPGVISLCKLTAPSLSPSFCHSAPASDEGSHCQQRAHAIASVTPALDPAHFIECVLDLFAHYQRGPDAACPLLVNTPGWIQGTGLDILSELITSLRPTEVVYMSQDGPEDTVSSLQAACAKITPATPFSTLPSQPSELACRTPLQLRTMQTMSYFHQRPPSAQQPRLPGPATPTWDPTPLADLRPWRVRYAGSKRGFLGILCYDHQPARELLAEAINGTVLALVKLESRAALRDLLRVGPSTAADGDATGDVTDVSRGQAEEASPAEDAARTGPDQPPERTTAAASSCDATTSPCPDGDGLPFIPNPAGLTLDPRHSRLLSLVLVRGVDVRRRELQLLVPQPLPAPAPIAAPKRPDPAAEDRAASPEPDVGDGGADLVLVAGRFDTPCWAYSEGLYLSRWRARRRGRAEPGSGSSPLSASESGSELSASEAESDEEEKGKEGRGAGEGAAVTEVPWVEMLHGSQARAVGSKVWRVRRDLGRA